MSDLIYCLNGSTIRPTPILDKIRIAGQAGYAAIELWHDEIEEFIDSGRSLQELKAALDNEGLELPTTIYLAGWFDATEADYPSIRDACKRRIEHAAVLGAHYVIASPPAGEADYDVGAARYRELLEVGRALGVKPAMEFLGFVGKLNTIEDALDVLTRADCEDGTTILDPFHVFRGGGAIESIAKLADQQIAISHFNDVPSLPEREQQHDADRVMPGEGVFDLRRYLELLKDTGYNRWLSLELFREDLWQRDPLEVARLGLDKMRSVNEA